MVSKRQQEHVKALLTEAITVLCKNGLGFEAQLNIEALIGITVDKEEVFLVNVNETVTARSLSASSVIELSCEDVCQSCPTLVPQTEIPNTGQGSPKRSRTHKRKQSSSNDMPPKLEKITKVDTNIPDNKRDPVEKRVRSGNSSPNYLKDTRKQHLSKEQPEIDQFSSDMNIKQEDRSKIDNKNRKNQEISNPGRLRRKSSMENVDKHRSEEEVDNKEAKNDPVDFLQNPEDSKGDIAQEINISSTSLPSSSRTSSPPNDRSSQPGGSPSSIEDLKSVSEQVAHLHTTEAKLQAVQYAEAVGNRAAGRAFDVSEATVRKWRKIKDKLIAEKTALI